MVAAPQLGTFVFVGIGTGQNYNKDIYISDVSQGLVNFSSGGVASATSQSHWRPPEDVLLVDFSVLTGLTDTEVLQLTRDSVPTGDVIRYANHLNTLNSRPRLNVAFAAGSEIRANQLAD
ncbi:hypothetical protein LCGC14_1804980 [marine sediment metagenome]|uniref:Uncharacterized protein n=1 Tax=marine sediment metagenome TaxID=412755 RepID=A0A0F9JN55_9ZZZZ